jgi:hypothetical protein
MTSYYKLPVSQSNKNSPGSYICPLLVTEGGNVAKNYRSFMICGIRLVLLGRLLLFAAVNATLLGNHPIPLCDGSGN